MLVLKSSVRPSRILRSAYHEAGHAAAVVVSGGPYWLRGISMRPQTGEVPERHRHSSAHLTIDPPVNLCDLSAPDQSARAEALLVIVMAGTVAEGMVERDRSFITEHLAGEQASTPPENADHGHQGLN